MAKLCAITDVPRSQRVQEAQRIADKQFNLENYPQLGSLKATAKPTWFGLGAPDIQIDAKDRKGKNVFDEEDFFSQGSGYMSLHKKPFRNQYDVEGDAVYLRPDMQGKGIGSRLAQDMVQTSRALGAKNFNFQADGAGKHVWAKKPGVEFQGNLGVRASKDYAKYRKAHGGPELPPNAAPAAYPEEFLKQWAPQAQAGVPFIPYRVRLQ
jgi:GNAT superfamily N-acetyltransferase